MEQIFFSSIYTPGASFKEWELTPLIFKKSIIEFSRILEKSVKEKNGYLINLINSYELMKLMNEFISLIKH